MNYEPIDSGLSQELKDIARINGFTHISAILSALAKDKSPTLTAFDKEQLVLFAKYIKTTAALKYPFWNDDLDNYVASNGEEYLEVINGVYGKFAAWLLDELRLPIEA